MSGKTGFLPDTKTVFEQSRKGRRAVVPPQKTVPEPANALPGEHLRKTPPELPELSQPQVVRHFTNLSRKNFCVDTAFYPLGISLCLLLSPKWKNEMLLSSRWIVGPIGDSN